MPALRGGAGVALRPDRMQPVLGQAAPGASRTDKHLPEIASLLDPKQFDLITRPESGVLAIQGSAGSGKTTVALHRVAYLAYQDARRFRGARCLLVVFSPALASYISQVLPALGVMDAQVRTYDSWVRSIRLRLFSKAPNIVAEDTPASVVRFKLHSALVPMIEEGIEANPDLGPWDLFEELFTNRQWVQSVERHAPGAFSANERKEILRWCSDMHFVRAEGGGHREHEVPSLDAEDDTLLLYLYQRVKGPLVSRKGRPLRYGHVVIDEAQDLSPVELRLLHGTVETGGAMTLAGDTAQRVVEHNDFVDWFHVLESLGLEHVSVSPLKVSYRSTASIMALAHEVLGPLAPPEAASPTRDGMEPELLRFRARGEAFTFLADALRELVQKEPSANVGVLVRHSWQAKEAYEALSRTDLDPLHRVVDHEFSFAPGIEVAEIRQAKGLEFDYVVLLDVDVDTYPRTDMARHLLHIGITRAAHQVWCFCVGSPSGLLPASIQTIQL
jgi:DNA helicase-2/ATP-dependent DNA helicase PcrA